jgi:hypothetical protein
LNPGSPAAKPMAKFTIATVGLEVPEIGYEMEQARCPNSKD